jgi:hypothetical protein
MPKRAIVGKSGVTPCKHDLLNKLLGREVGTLKANKLDLADYMIVDLTAGDGVPYAGKTFWKGCSPGIILHHTKYVAGQTWVSCNVLLLEKQHGTWLDLLANIERDYDQNKDVMVNTLCVDSKSYDFLGLKNADAAFLYNDPNHIEDWCLTPEILAKAPKFTTSLSTLGCNVGGMKRLDLDKRELWFDRINMVTSSIVQPWHDACLLSVGGADQWAYLVTAPTKWRDQITSDCLAAASKMEGREADPQIAWFKQDPAAFLALQQYLFLTKAENAQR